MQNLTLPDGRNGADVIPQRVLVSIGSLVHASQSLFSNRDFRLSTECSFGSST